MRFVAFLLLTLALTVPVDAEIVPAHRRINWAPGIPGGIPHRTTIYTTLAAGSTVAQINSALTACPSNQVVMLSAGTYSVNQTIVVPSYKTLRGAGPDSTILNLSGTGNAPIRFGSETGPSASTYTSVTAGLTKGSTNITVASASGIGVGSLLMISQLDDTSFVTATGSSGYCDWCDAGMPNDRDMGQIVEVTSLNGNILGINPPLYWPYNNSPYANRYSAGCWRAGVEDLTVYANNTGWTANFLMSGSAYCWIRNVESDFADGDHCRIYWSVLCEVRDCYFHDGFNHGPGQTDNSLALAHKSSSCLVENNIFWRQHVGIMLEWGAAGNVVGYNIFTNQYTDNANTWFAGAIDFHGAHPSFNLFEGNIGTGLSADSTWGSSSHITFLRNAFAGSDYYCPPQSARGALNCAAGTWEDDHAVGYSMDYLTRTNNFIGNIGGGTRLIANGGVYLKTNGTMDVAEFRFGFNSDSFAWMNNNSWFSTIFHGNYSHKNVSQQWDPSIADHTIPDSYYLSSKPSWFGSLTWPPINPSTATSLSLTSTPAGYRFTFGTNPPTAGPDTNPPTVLGRAIPTSGSTLEVSYSEAVLFGAGGNGGLTLSASGGALTPTYSSGSGSSTHTYTLSRTVAAGETITASYTQPGNGIEDSIGNDLSSYSGITVTNNSTYETDAPTPDPMTFATAPFPVGARRVEMVATTATDSNTVTYQFEVNGTTQAWQSATSLVVTNLAIYSSNYFRVRAKDSFDNTTDWSDYAGAVTFTEQVFNSSSSFTVPSGVTNILVELWGAGGSSGGTATTRCAGGGGGAYARTNFVVTPLESIAFTIGAGGSGVPTTMRGARAVAGTNSNSGTVGGGGSASASIGAVVYSGGAGGARSGTSTGGGGGGGGGSGGYFGSGTAGSAGSGTTGGAGGAGAADAYGGGGNGGTNGAVSSANNGTSPGGGGGGRSGSGTHPSGAAGRVVVSWGVPDTEDPALDTTPPTVILTDPSSNSPVWVTVRSCTIGFTATDNVAVTSVHTHNNRNNYTGSATNISANSYGGFIPLEFGSNFITLTAYDAAGNSGQDDTVVYYVTPATGLSVSSTGSVLRVVGP